MAGAGRRGWGPARLPKVLIFDGRPLGVLERRDRPLPIDGAIAAAAADAAMPRATSLVGDSRGGLVCGLALRLAGLGVRCAAAWLTRARRFRRRRDARRRRWLVFGF